MIGLGLALGLALGCKGEAKQEVPKRVHPPAPKVDNVSPECAGVAAAARAAFFDQADRAPTDAIRIYSEHMADAVVRVYERHCSDDKWSAAAIACAKAGSAGGSGSAANCDATLTEEQLKKLQDDPAINL